MKPCINKNCFYYDENYISKCNFHADLSKCFEYRFESINEELKRRLIEKESKRRF